MSSSRAAAENRQESPPPSLNEDDEEKNEDVEIPLTMTASVVLTSLPKDARTALRDAGAEKGGERKGKESFVIPWSLHGLGIHQLNLSHVVTVHFRPIGSAPGLPPKQIKSTVSAHHPFSFVVRFLRRRLKLKDTESIFCYLHNCWSPSLDETIGDLWNVSASFLYVWEDVRRLG